MLESGRVLPVREMQRPKRVSHPGGLKAPCPNGISDQASCMAIVMLEGALEVIRAYYTRFTAASRALRERGMSFRETSQATGLASQGLLLRAKADIARLALIEEDAAQPPERRVISDEEVIAHARRILNLWWIEDLAELAEPELLPPLLRFDGDYLYLGAFVYRLLEIRPSGRISLNDGQRAGIAHDIGQVFRREVAGGRKPMGPPPRKLKAEYQSILKELKSPPPQRNVEHETTLRRIGAYEFGWRSNNGERISTAESTTTASSLRQLIVVRPGERRELVGLEKVVAFHFPTTLIRRDRRGTLQLTKANDDALSQQKATNSSTASRSAPSSHPRPHSAARAKLTISWPLTGPALAEQTLLDKWQHILNKVHAKRRPQFAAAAQHLLAAKYGYDSDRVRGLVSTKYEDEETKDVSAITDIDKDRRWDQLLMYPSLGHRHSSNAQNCGVATEHIEALAIHATQTRPVVDGNKVGQ